MRRALVVLSSILLVLGLAPAAHGSVVAGRRRRLDGGCRPVVPHDHLVCGGWRRQLRHHLVVVLPALVGLTSLAVALGGGSPALAAVAARPATQIMSAYTGPSVGGTPVRIVGTGLTHIQHVYFGTSLAHIVNYGHGNAVSVIAPPHGEARVFVRVQTSAGLSVAVARTIFGYVNAPRTWTGVVTTLPNDAERLTVTGFDFTPHATILVNGRPVPTEVQPDALPGRSGTLVAELPEGTLMGAGSVVGTYQVRTEYGVSATRTVTGDYHPRLPRWSVSASLDLVSFAPSMACPAVNTCLAVTAGEYATFNGRTWTDHPSDVLTSNDQLACVTADECLVAAGGGQLARWDGASWTTETVTLAAVDLPALSCVSSGVCVALGRDGHTYVRDANGWTDHGAGGPTRVPGLRMSCTSTTFCAAAGYSDAVWRWDGSAWTSSTLPRPLNSVVLVGCDAHGFCLAGGANGLYELLAPTSAWAAVPDVGDLATATVGCAPDACAAADDDGELVVVTPDTTAFSLISPHDSNGNEIPEVSCASDLYCVVTDRAGTFAGATR